MSDEALDRLERAVAAMRARLDEYRRPAEPLVLETARALDQIFCRDLFPEAADDGDVSREERAIMADGVNDALSRVLPTELALTDFRMFPSTRQTRAQTDSFLFDCGRLVLAERQASFLREGLLSGRLERLDGQDARALDTQDLLVLEASSPSAYAESVGRRGRRWASSEAQRRDRSRERELERRHSRMLEDLTRRVHVVEGHYLGFQSSPEIDVHFAEWAEIYLNRMPHQDMIGPDEIIGGRSFADYVAALKALSASAHRQLCFAGLLKHRRPDLVFRNLMTRFQYFDDMLKDVAASIGSDTVEAQRLLSHLILDPFTAPNHLDRGDIAWAPGIRSSEGFCIMPVYGLDMNPFLYLLNDLRQRYEKDWFRLANRRESRWLTELEAMFPTERWAVNAANLKLKKDGKDRTDIDFAVQDPECGDIALFQLKWQQPTLTDPAVRRSNASNLLSQCNDWVERVEAWIAENGAGELATRLGFPNRQPPRIFLFVLARYGAHFTGHGGRSDKAVWSDWAHFRKVRAASPRHSLSALAAQLAKEIETAQSKIRFEQAIIPLPGICVILNPTNVKRSRR